MSRLLLGSWLAALALLCAAQSASAQAPAAAVPAAGVPAGAAGAAGTAATAVKPGCLEKICVRCEAFRRKLCVTPAGALINNMTRPLTTLTGGVIPPFCPILPSAADLAKPGVAGAAAEGKKDAAEAKARQMDVRYLGTLDCRYYPNASKGLADGLRMDPSECVRFEAAQALSRGCCCNKVTLAALEASVSGMDIDGNPGERSVRVRCTAAIALEKCLACYVAPAPEPEPVDPKKVLEGPKGEGPMKKDDEKPQDTDAKPPLSQSPAPAAIAKARKTLIAFQELYANTQHPALTPGSGPGSDQSLFSILKGNTVEPAPRTVVATATPEPAPLPIEKIASKPVEVEPAVTNTKPAFTSAPVIKMLKVEPETPVIPVPAVMPQSAAPLTGIIAPASFAIPVARDATAVEVLNCSKQLLLSKTDSEKHAAVRAIVKFDWTQHPRVASALLAGAASDQPATVRVDCIRHLAHHNINHPQVLADLQSLCGDSDAWVKQEATKALVQLKADR